MSEKPILFNTEMVRAILDGRKTQTRRVIRFPEGTTGHLPPSGAKDYIYWPGGIKRAPYKPGDTLWVRETWKQYTTGTAGAGLIDGYLYKADEPLNTSGMMVEGRWHPSIHMPKEAARIWLKVNDIRCERIQDITNKDAKAEGMNCATDNSGQMHRFKFQKLWDSISDEKSNWDANPWVWVISFERIERDLLRYADNDVMQGGLLPAT